mmetsp:Transcript_36142/g.58426  ORF Transcript_36142/g.58426 Transcript_36142/m.58426 type:complete len:519 (+) Transcript_36142:289-1845(+)|eukprot:CAMPEP_0184654418 /NCGR_PEP_ID=MMETSP0308-20130426/12098_1 /TAXON_ID=38269 /ORGANISM="Gloeochaete witrockiana, Strain SAG 46.84" /LENGTH=518 /DNA_ID=CAMNT_0027090393 /DNA_START=165 /DNA_END=1721 /DNA_ORIENTATION=+
MPSFILSEPRRQFRMFPWALLCLPVAASFLAGLFRIVYAALKLSAPLFNLLVELKEEVLLVSIVLIVAFRLLAKSRRVYLVDFACFRGRKESTASFEYARELYASSPAGTDESARSFLSKLTATCGVGPYTYLSDGIKKRDFSMESARGESEEAMFGVLDDLFARCNIKPSQVGILVVNCSLFNPTPSLTAMIVRHYKMGSSTLTYNLSGMGCSAGVIAIDLASDLLKVHRNSYAVVVSTENITQNWYMGTEKSMLIPNVLFRMGASAALLSNRSADRRRAKYQLITTVRTHKGADEEAYQAVYQCEDAQGNRGVRLSKSLMQVAGDVLRLNISVLAPRILPVSEMIKFAVTNIRRKVLNHKIKPYTPDFTKAVQHFCIHAGGRGVIDALEKNLNLRPYYSEPSRAALWRFGNTSSSSIWYEMLYLETHQRMHRNNRVWQIAFGSGFKCNSAVWKCLSTPRRSLEEWTCGFPVEEEFAKFLEDSRKVCTNNANDDIKKPATTADAPKTDVKDASHVTQ